MPDLSCGMMTGRQCIQGGEYGCYVYDDCDTCGGLFVWSFGGFVYGSYVYSVSSCIRKYFIWGGADWRLELSYSYSSLCMMLSNISCAILSPF